MKIIDTRQREATTANMLNADDYFMTDSSDQRIYRRVADFSQTFVDFHEKRSHYKIICLNNGGVHRLLPMDKVYKVECELHIS